MEERVLWRLLGAVEAGNVNGTGRITRVCRDGGTGAGSAPGKAVEYEIIGKVSLPERHRRELAGVRDA